MLLVLANRPVRILLREVPAILFEIIVDAAASKPDIELVDGRKDPHDEVLDRNVDVVLAASIDPHSIATARELLCRSVATRVVLLTPTGQQGAVYDLVSRPLCSVDLSPTSLLNVMCAGLTHRVE